MRMIHSSIKSTAFVISTISPPFAFLISGYLSSEISSRRQFSYLRYGSHMGLGQICSESPELWTGAFQRSKTFRIFRAWSILRHGWWQVVAMAGEVWGCKQVSGHRLTRSYKHVLLKGHSWTGSFQCQGDATRYLLFSHLVAPGGSSLMPSRGANQWSTRPWLSHLLKKRKNKDEAWQTTAVHQSCGIRWSCSKSYKSIWLSAQGIHQWSSMQQCHCSTFTPEESVAESQGGAKFGGRLGVPKKWEVGCDFEVNAGA